MQEMLKQIDRQFSRFMRLYSCFFLCLVYLFRRKSEYVTHTDIMLFYWTMVKKGNILHEGFPPKEPWYRCWISNKEMIAKSLSGRSWTYKKLHPSENFSDASFVIEEWETPQGTSHFIVPDQLSIDGYNPDPNLILKKLRSQRVFTRVPFIIKSQKSRKPAGMPAPFYPGTSNQRRSPFWTKTKRKPAHR